MKDTFSIIDQVIWVHRNKDGKILRKWDSNNWLNRLLIKLHLRKHQLITNIGLAQIAAFLLKDVDADHTSFPNCDWQRLGTGTTNPNDPTQTELANPVGSQRLAGTGTRVTTTVTNDTAQHVVTFSKAADSGLTGTMSITEVGLYWHASNSSTMLMRQVFSAESVNWDAGDTFEVTIKIQVKQGS